MLSILAAGQLVRDPQTRTTKDARTYVTALMRCPVEDGDALLISLIVFNESAVVALLLLRQGDALSVAGRGKLTEWEKDGETKHGLSVLADRVLTAYQAGKVRKQAQEVGGEA